MLEMQRLLQTERLQQSVRDSWVKVWTLNQASVETRKLVIDMEDILNNGIWCAFTLGNTSYLDILPPECSPVSPLLVLPYMLPDSRVKPDHERLAWAIPVSFICVHIMCVGRGGVMSPECESLL